MPDTSLVPLQDDVDRLNALLPAANAGNRAASRQLRSVLDATPQLWLEVGNLGRQAELALVRVAAGDNPVTKEAIVRKLDTLRREVTGPRPSTLERLLADIAGNLIHLLLIVALAILIYNLITSRRAV